MKLIAMTLASLSLLASSTAQADPTKAREDVRAVAPALEKYRQDTLFGDLWKRPGLNLRDRSIVTLAALITRNQTAEMPHYLNFALDNGVKPSEVSEIVTHLAFYAGWGNAIAAVAVVKDVFAAHKIAADQLPPASPKLLALNEAAEADRAKRVGDLFGAVFPGVTQYTTDVLFRDLWLRPGLAPRDRSLVTISEQGKRTHDYAVGTIGYWPPGPDVAIFYRQDGERIPDPGLIVLGKIKAGVEALNVPGAIRATIELS